jgi:hypothetical protein
LLTIFSSEGLEVRMELLQMGNGRSYLLRRCYYWWSSKWVELDGEWSFMIKVTMSVFWNGWWCGISRLGGWFQEKYSKMQIIKVCTNPMLPDLFIGRWKVQCCANTDSISCNTSKQRSQNWFRDIRENSRSGAIVATSGFTSKEPKIKSIWKIRFTKVFWVK